MDVKYNHLQYKSSTVHHKINAIKWTCNKIKYLHLTMWDLKTLYGCIALLFQTYQVIKENNLSTHIPHVLYIQSATLNHQ